jgi:hypothetical protein
MVSTFKQTAHKRSDDVYLNKLQREGVTKSMLYTLPYRPVEKASVEKRALTKDLRQRRPSLVRGLTVRRCPQKATFFYCGKNVES